MSIELPILRLGLAGFTAEQHAAVEKILERGAPGHVEWQLGRFHGADAWWCCGQRLQVLPDNTIRIAPGLPTARSLQLNLGDVDRPIAFSTPLAQQRFEPAYSFALEDPGSAQAVLAKFSAWLQPQVAQFCLASSLTDHYGSLGPGCFDVLLDGRLIAVVDLRGKVSVLPTADPIDFTDAIWRRHQEGATEAPGHFVHSTVSHLMWQYAMRTKRDLLPPHYRTGPIFFRRAPRLPQRLMNDSHLLLLRELASGAGTAAELMQRTGMYGPGFLRDLSALYVVGAVTSNPKRAAIGTLRHADLHDSSQSPHSDVLPSSLEHRPRGALGLRMPTAPDLTVPVPLMPR